jgi:hypothetical protein
MSERTLRIVFLCYGGAALIHWAWRVVLVLT